MKVERLRGSKLQQRRKSYLRLRPLCARCEAKGLVALAEVLDHIVALCNGGSDDDPNNWQGLCIPCHKDKTAEDLGQKVKVAVGLDGWPVSREGA
jgi:5-methylcytosine-specific restriction protein A